MQQPLVIGNRYWLGSDGALPSHDHADVIRDAVTVANVLRRCVGEFHEMRLLRAEVATAHRAEYVTALSDVAVVELAGRLVSHGRLRLLRLVPDPTGRGVPLSDAPAPAAAAPASPASAPRRAAEVEVVPSFSADLDAGALVAVLLAASQDGTPFCEECARAARAA